MHVPTSTDRYLEHAERLKAADLRPTRQRIALSLLLWRGCDRHVTAERLHAEAHAAGIGVSLATVYNTLHQFTKAGLLCEIGVGNGSSYFDTNTRPHHHFLNIDSGELMDVEADLVPLTFLPCLPSGTAFSQVDVIIRVRNC